MTDADGGTGHDMRQDMGQDVGHDMAQAMEGTERWLLLHSGGAKTGTSAIQNLLRAGTDRLAAAGVAYAGAKPLAHATEITSGNAPPLAKAMDAGDRAEATRLIEMFLDGGALGLASSETLEAVEERGWRLLVEVAAEAGVRLRVAHVVRDPLPLLLSVYDQKVKRHGESRPVASWAQTHRLRVFGFLRMLHALAGEGALDLVVLRYETARADLGGALMGALGLGPELLGGVPGEGTQVNRSLDRAERRVMLEVNAALGERHSREVSDLLISVDPTRRAEPPRDPSLAPLLRERHGEDVAWVNRTFFPEGPGLALPEEGDGDVEDGSGGGEAAPPATPEAVVLAWALAQLAKGAAPDAAGLVRHIQAMRRAARPADPDLPEDFDPVGYLLANPRLLERRVNPFTHYLRHGRARGFRWT